MQQPSTLPGCPEQLAFCLGINCGSNPKKLLLHPSNVSRHVRKPVHQPAGKTKTQLCKQGICTVMFLHTLSHAKQLFSSQINSPNRGVHFFPTSPNSHLALSCLFYKLRKGVAQITASLSGWPVSAFQHRNPVKQSCLQELCGRNFLLSLKQDGRGRKTKRRAQWKNKEKAKQQCLKCTFFFLMIPLIGVSYIRVGQGRKLHREIWGNLLPPHPAKMAQKYHIQWHRNKIFHWNSIWFDYQNWFFKIF